MAVEARLMDEDRAFRDNAVIHDLILDLARQIQQSEGRGRRGARCMLEGQPRCSISSTDVSK